jgi:uncharacterized protein (DUF2141 family)
MMKRACAMTGALLCVGAAPVSPNPSLGKAEAACRPGETGPALLVTAIGLKDRMGLLRAELYPDNDNDFLQDDAILINQGKTFRRSDLTLTPTNTPTLCLRLPAPGRYALSLLHDRDGNLKFGVFSDGIGFPGNPKLSRSKPKAASALVVAGPGITRIAIRMNYLHGLFSFGPLEER